MPHTSNNIRRTGFGDAPSGLPVGALIIDKKLIFVLDKVSCRGVFILTYSNTPSREEDQNLAGRQSSRMVKIFESLGVHASVGHPKNTNGFGRFMPTRGVSASQTL